MQETAEPRLTARAKKNTCVPRIVDRSTVSSAMRKVSSKQISLHCRPNPFITVKSERSRRYLLLETRPASVQIRQRPSVGAARQSPYEAERSSLCVCRVIDDWLRCGNRSGRAKARRLRKIRAFYTLGCVATARFPVSHASAPERRRGRLIGHESR